MKMTRPRRRTAEPVQIKEIVADLLREAGYENAVKEQQVLTAWSEIAGAEIAKNSQPTEIRNMVCFIKVKNSVWRTQLSFFRESLVDKINAYAGKKIVTSIHFSA
ncbi:MAG: hypothetical protein A2268_10650 [Candidatus Raymondbacteria bacterium RifOxyA12_full_50_37]|uniref:DUF721 domain-containing protein n=1 Tax=Candidatus Raymondbacteria bacterium RIFOXYD12_FULL_49_13 TaxID=1817890 RepID=A0A1F7F8Z2_UNCRA|nr:MAG: hypothetical protein A2268_10650 [Candidatus Raymondbacteria bacterium RifOxyA12_full_50_37]OGJ85423.1 MAG: hypothetical protein A2248_12435 [Candidatus Raymondbacteria bacterium RIFOXYA2_FULL_49_16]OGJ94931.1 MAG: hypothetical protein A2453_07905 [Candidatus Raymondbacteria bacterium RIFOXYC2_FULL_50_21]OGJ98688.1 MAG: hypothetical protein A2487_05755 [Candidatus Raymondbacteria bacterium RifOxyC12_full_50_8]OGK03048.1 MAG: hypothetical protein A2519_21390 [Candidatus Raymondbacteria b